MHKKIQYLTVVQIEEALLTRSYENTAFVLPKPIADIVYHPALQYANGTPVYHILSEPYSKCC